ncbi:delta-60 repeat domain-containing protein [Streptomyces sp. AcE210]|uniref:delta-60 repeat domain-containing protein n=1 Tax=Streptomyces sp. AcE210 TaxID=2292703 RepID=UPI001404366A|nr:delta-60 repeat domain-containing protein [Streptomyces sp. AcE210]
MVTTDFGGMEEARGVAVQTDGKIITAGRTSVGDDFALARYNTDGSLDTSFDTDGKVTTDFGGTEEAFGVAVQTDGKIITAGRTSVGDDFALARYTTDGSLDTSFDTDGKVTTDFGGMEEARGVVLQADGKLIASGFTSSGGNFDFALARFNTDGSLDTSFDTDGKVTTDFGGTDQAFGVAVQTDGKIVTVGDSSVGGGFALARFNTDGSLDTSFDTDGKVSTDFGLEALGVALQTDGKIVAVGRTNNQFALARFNTDGSLDTSFDTDGKVTADTGGTSSVARDVAVQTDGKIVAAGVGGPAGSRFALVRFNTDGSLDTSFETGDVGGAANGVVVQTDGKIVAAGVTGGEAGDFALARYEGVMAPLPASTCPSPRPGRPPSAVAIEPPTP